MRDKESNIFVETDILSQPKVFSKDPVNSKISKRIWIFAGLMILCGLLFYFLFDQRTYHYDMNARGEMVNGEMNGLWTFFRENGTKYRDIEHLNGKREGQEMNWLESGVLISKWTFRNDIREGPFIQYDSLGNIIQSGSLVSGYYHGEIMEYNKQGIVSSISKYDLGVLID